MYYRYRDQGNEGTQANTRTFFLLLDLLTFFDFYHDANIEEALKVWRNQIVYASRFMRFVSSTLQFIPHVTLKKIKSFPNCRPWESFAVLGFALSNNVLRPLDDNLPQKVLYLYGVK